MSRQLKSPAQRDKIEAAIKLLQDEGYEVFNSTAGLVLQATHAVDHGMYNAYSEQEGYKHHLETVLRRTLAESQPFRDMCKYTFLPAPAEDSARYGLMAGRSQHILTVKTFPSVRKEWRRR